MGQGEQEDLMDDLLQENEALREQLQKAIDLEVSTRRDLNRALKGLLYDARVFLKIPDSLVAAAIDVIAQEDGDALLRGLDAQC